MALDVLNTVDIIEVMENYIEKVRPPEEIRAQLDTNYRIDNQSVILFDIRPQWNDKAKILTLDFAKTTYEKKNDCWKIYWLRASQKWNLYKPMPVVMNLSDFLQVVTEDKLGCFHG